MNTTIHSDGDPRTTEQIREDLKSRLEFWIEPFTTELKPGQEVPMTKATEMIFGGSGRGSPKAVKIIETLAQYGGLKIRKAGRARFVSLKEEK